MLALLGHHSLLLTGSQNSLLSLPSGPTLETSPVEESEESFSHVSSFELTLCLSAFAVGWRS